MRTKYKWLLESGPETLFYFVEHKTVHVFGTEWLRGVM